MENPIADLRPMTLGGPAATTAGAGLAARARAFFAQAADLLHWAEAHAARGQESDR